MNFLVVLLISLLVGHLKENFFRVVLNFLFSDIICKFPSQLFLVTTKRLKVASIVRIDRSSSVNTNATDINKVGELFHKY